MTSWEPTVSDVSVKAAVPLVSETVPRDVVPSIKLTLPVAVPAPGATAETIAVKVTDCPSEEGLGAAVKLVFVEAVLTTCDKAGLDVLLVKLALPA